MSENWTSDIKEVSRTVCRLASGKPAPIYTLSFLRSVAGNPDKYITEKDEDSKEAIRIKMDNRRREIKDLEVEIAGLQDEIELLEQCIGEDDLSIILTAEYALRKSEAFHASNLSANV